MDRIRTLLAAIVSSVLTLGFLGCAYLTIQGKGQAYYQGIVTPATTMLFLGLTLAIVILAILPESNSTETAQDSGFDPSSIHASSGSASSGPMQVRAVVEVSVEEE